MPGGSFFGSPPLGVPLTIGWLHGEDYYPIPFLCFVPKPFFCSLKTPSSNTSTGDVSPVLPYLIRFFILQHF
jgi:hypothetical protein